MSSPRSLSRTLTLLVPTLALGMHLASPGLAAQDPDVDASEMSAVDRAARSDLVGNTSGVGAAVLYEGEMDLLAAWGTPSAGSEEQLNPQYLFPFRGLSDLMLAATIRALADAGQIDVNRSLGTMIAELPPVLATVTLDQLLSHTAGLDDARVPEGVEWDTLLDDFPESARIAPPGSLYSWSRYSYPVAARALERILNATFAEIAQFAIIAPLGMSRTSFDPGFAEMAGVLEPFGSPVPPSAIALPIAYTTPADVVQFVAAWMGGAIRGSTPGDQLRDTPIGAVFSDGLRVASFDGLRRATLARDEDGVAVSLEIYPEASSVLLAWGNGNGPNSVRQAIQQDVHFALGILGQDPAPMPPGELIDESWAGRYRNGDLILELRSGTAGMALFDGEAEVPLILADRNVYIAQRNGGSLAFTAVLAGSQRILYVGDRAYLRR